jgi:phosphatidate cytidylyltransferase
LTLFFILSRDSTLLSILNPYFDVNQRMPLILTSIVIISLIWLLLRPHKENAFAAWAWTIAGVTYLGWLLGYLVALRYLNDGRNWVFFALFVTFTSDSTAFFVGRTWGRHYLSPPISPAKTWEGAIGGVLGSIILSLFFTLPTPLNLPLNYGQAMLLGLLVSILGQLGDLVKSLFKRNMGVKDSGKLLPGHGGVLDRTDSVVFAGVVVYYYALLISGAMS